ncbi:uncharacterized protein LOC142328877 [Lycorma delicatula]|uniref:uncharacterized protein LOC142328877 n=1 Tax=Lycorma delicatula TaxID=130591 RepID=UPI003F513623
MYSTVLFTLAVTACIVTVAVQAESSPVTPTTTAVPTTSQSKVSQDVARASIKEQLAALTQSCKTSSHATPDDIKIISSETVPKTDGEKCFLQCIYNGLGIVKNDQFSVEGSKILAQKRFSSSPDELAKANQMIEICSKEAVKKDSKEKCPMGRQVRECFVKNGAKINFFPKA